MSEETARQDSRLVLSIGNHVNSKQEALEFGDLSLQESIAFANATVSREAIDEYKQVKIYAIEVTGPQPIMKDSPNLVYHAKIPIGMSSQEFYDFLVSVEGYEFIDPDADPNDFNKPIFGPFFWNDGEDNGTSRIDYRQEEDMIDGNSGHHHYCQVEHAKLDNLPFFMAKRDYTVLNSFNPSAKSFISASCNYPQDPGSSPYDRPEKEVLQHQGVGNRNLMSVQYHHFESNENRIFGKDEYIRMAFWGSYMVQEVENNVANDGLVADEEDVSSCVLVVSQWMDMNGKTPSFINNYANQQWFHSFIDRVQERFPINKKETLLTSGGDASASNYSTRFLLRTRTIDDDKNKSIISINSALILFLGFAFYMLFVSRWSKLISSTSSEGDIEGSPSAVVG